MMRWERFTQAKGGPHLDVRDNRECSQATEYGVTKRPSWLRPQPGTEVPFRRMNETIRNYLKRRIRWSWGVAIASWVVFPLSVAAGKEQIAWLDAVGAVGFFGAILSMLWIKCPRCSVRVGQSIAGTLAVPFLKPQPNFCPFCGVSLDEPRVKPVAHTTQQPFNPIR
jgi:hypothetical protein